MSWAIGLACKGCHTRSNRNEFLGQRFATWCGCGLDWALATFCFFLSFVSFYHLAWLTLIVTVTNCHPFMITQFEVEFQSYPSMKWQPAQFEMCVVQEVSLIRENCKVNISNYYVGLVYLTTSYLVCALSQNHTTNVTSNNDKNIFIIANNNKSLWIHNLNNTSAASKKQIARQHFGDF